MDWKEALLAQSRAMGLEPEADDTASDTSAPAESQKSESPKGLLHIAVEKKGRGGKIATIVFGFECSDELLKQTAATIKSRLGTGGSARDGEILIQGDRSDDVRRVLTDLGWKVK